MRGKKAREEEGRIKIGREKRKKNRGVIKKHG